MIIQKRYRNNKVHMDLVVDTDKCLNNKWSIWIARSVPGIGHNWKKQVIAKRDFISGSTMLRRLWGKGWDIIINDGSAEKIADHSGKTESLDEVLSRHIEK